MMASSIGGASAFHSSIDMDGFEGGNDLAIGANLISNISRVDPIGLPLDAPAQIPDIVRVDFVQPTANALIMPTTPVAKFGGAKLDLGQGYRLTVDERDQSLLFENEKAEAQTIIWGNGKITGNTVNEPLQFWGTTSFTFGDEGKITLETQESKTVPGEYLLDKISVSTADRGVVITGLTNDVVGDLKVDESKSAGSVDNNARDGFTLIETEDGHAWLDEDEIAITQSLLDATAIGRLFGPGSEYLSSVEFSALLSRFMTNWNLFSMVSSLTRYSAIELHQSVENKSDSNKISERRLIERVLIEQAMVKRSIGMPRLFG
jgi:hypothetical protein